MKRLFAFVPFLLMDCGGGSSTTYDSTTTLTSTSLEDARRNSDLHAATCPTGSLCLTPTEVSGRVYNVGLMVGGNGGGSSGVKLSTVCAVQEVCDRPDLGEGDAVGGSLPFEFREVTDLSGKYSCCGGPIGYPSDADAVVSRLEAAFDYLDTTFTVPAGSALAGNSYTIRIIYVDDNVVTDVISGQDSTVYLGDKLVKAEGETTFKWCDSRACTYSTRPSSPLQDSDIAEYEPPSVGNPHYFSFAIGLTEPLSFTQTEAETGDWKFTADFLVTNAAIFNISNWSSISTVKQLVDAFRVSANPGEDTSTSVTVTMTKEPLASE